MKSWLLDTGPIVAYIDRTDPAHDPVTARWNGFRGRIATTSAVITEAMHLVGDAGEGPAVLAELVAASGMEVHDYTQPPALRVAAALMKRYADTPMDFADATLVLLADDIRVHEIFTLDGRGFTVFRTAERRAFRLVL